MRTHDLIKNYLCKFHSTKNKPFKTCIIKDKIFLTKSVDIYLKNLASTAIFS